MKKKLFIHSPAFNLLHPTNNKDTDFSGLYESSSILVSWQCKKDIRHIWEQKICSKTRQGYDCPYCSGRRTLKEESFAAVYPEIAKELHPTKNQHFDPWKYSPTSNIEVTWMCCKKHEWVTRVERRTRGKDSKCPTCRKIKNSFAKKHPELLKQWHSAKNKPLDPYMLSASSNMKVWWMCNENKEHKDWKRTIGTRTTYDAGCPTCRKNQTDKPKAPLPPLSEYSKTLTSEWHPTRNKGIKPSDFTAGSGQRVWWKCSTCKHVWKTAISNRARKNRGCGACSKRFPSKGKSIADNFPELVKQWHPTNNGKLKPKNFSSGSAQEIWWQCTSNPEHVWSEAIRWRTKRKSYECRICKKQKNTLQTVFPEIAKEWHPIRNGELKPSDFTKASGTKVWWLCSVNPDHEWEATIHNRTINNSNCNQCANEKIGQYLGKRDFELDKKDVDTHHVFTTAVASLLLLVDYPYENNKRLIQPVYRMVYSSVITSLESYLSDTFINKIEGISDLIAKIITTSKDLNEKKYSVTDILEWHKNVESRVIKHLNDIIWHNIHKVRNLYNDVLEITFSENTQIITKAVGIRHDLVHRNGKTKKGKMHMLTKNEVVVLISETEKFVEKIQRQAIEI